MPNTPEHLRNVTRNAGPEEALAFKPGVKVGLGWITIGFVAGMAMLVAVGDKIVKKGMGR